FHGVAAEQAHQPVLARAGAWTGCPYPVRGRSGSSPSGSLEPAGMALSRALFAGKAACHRPPRPVLPGCRVWTRTHTGFRALFQLTSEGRITIRTGVALPLGERRANSFASPVATT